MNTESIIICNNLFSCLFYSLKPKLEYEIKQHITIFITYLYTLYAHQLTYIKKP
jgi:hypothetical protein